MQSIQKITRWAGAALALVMATATAAAADTPIYSIQGSNGSSTFAEQTVTTTGVVTKLNNNGFFLQDLTGDGDPLTSDGIFVFTGSAPTAAVGQYLRLTARVVEFNTGAAANLETAGRTVTQLTTISAVQLLGTGYSLAPVNVTLPLAAYDDLERYEGMLITVTGPLTVTQNYFQARYGQVSMSAGGRLEVPTNRFRPGPQADAMLRENARRRIVLDDGSSVQNINPTPYIGADNTLRAGDTVDAITGVLDYGLATASNLGSGDYRLHPTVTPRFARSNPRPAAPAAVGGNVKAASFNVLNFFTTFGNGETAAGLTGQGCKVSNSTAAANCRGANNAAEFARQRSKIIEALAAINADVLGFMEIQNNGAVALQNLVDGLNLKLGTAAYALVPDPVGMENGGTGTDAIKVALIYKPAKLALAGPSRSDFAAIHNRPPLAQSFTLSNGEKFSVVVNHFKSKGSCPAPADADFAGNNDSQDGQACWNARRVQQAQALRSFVARLQASAGHNDVLLIGDFNAYAQEDPMFDLTSSGFVDQVGRFDNFAYSYVFDGAAGRLDQALASATLSAKVNRAVEWHINADEPFGIDYNLEFKQPACPACAPDPYTATPYRSSDHDPVVLGLNLFKKINGTTARDSLVGGLGDEQFTGGPGADVLTGGGGVNVYVYQSMRDAGDTITDFVAARDQIDLRPLLAGLGFSANANANANTNANTNARLSDWVRVTDTAVGASVQIATAGPGSAFRPLLTLRAVSAANIDLVRDLLTQ